MFYFRSYSLRKNVQNINCWFSKSCDVTTWVSRFNKYINEHSSVIIQSNSIRFCTWILNNKTHKKNISNFVAKVTLPSPGPWYEISITCYIYPRWIFFQTMIFPLNFRHAYVWQANFWCHVIITSSTIQLFYKNSLRSLGTIVLP